MKESPSYKHFIITLFNLKIWKEDKSKMPTQTDEWLKQRFIMFENYCLPSIKRQTCQDFVWLCLFDIDTPVAYKQRIEELREQAPQLTPCYFTAEEASQFRDKDNDLRCKFIREKVASLLNNEDFVITTNLDNDDALQANFTKRLHQIFEERKEEALVTFKKGMQYFVELDAVIKMYYPHNHFLNLIERTNKDFLTIEYYRHAEARKKLSCIDINETTYWMEIVHNCNVSNELRITSRVKYLPQLTTFSFSKFGLKKSLSWSQNLYNFGFVLPKYFFKIALWRLKKKIHKQ